MALDRDQTTEKSPAPDRRASKSHRETMRSLLLPLSEAPANDNGRGLVWEIYAFFARHLNWLLPTLALAALSFFLLSLKH